MERDHQQNSEKHCSFLINLRQVGGLQVWVELDDRYMYNNVKLSMTQHVSISSLTLFAMCHVSDPSLVAPVVLFIYVPLLKLCLS